MRCIKFVYTMPKSMNMMNELGQSAWKAVVDPEAPFTELGKVHFFIHKGSPIAPYPIDG